MLSPSNIATIGDEIAIAWSNGDESYIKMDFLRSRSPSAENTGEKDLVGNVIYAGDGKKDFRNITVQSWQVMGGYAIQFHFSDGHNTGLYTYDFLKELGQTQDQSLPDPDQAPSPPEEESGGGCGTSGCGCSS